MRNDMPSRQQKQEYFALNDYDLVVQFKSGNKKAGDLLIKKYAGLLLNTSVKKYKQFRSANDLEFADAEQDMFLLFFEALNDVKPRKIKNRKSFNMYIMFHNRVCRYNDYNIRRINNYNEFRQSRMQDYAMQESKKNASVITNYNLIIDELRPKLSGHEAPIFDLFYQGHKPLEISKQLGMTKQNVSYHMKNIKRKACDLAYVY